MRSVLRWTMRLLLLALVIAFVWGFIAYWRSTNDCATRASVPQNPMKAVRYCEYGSPDVVKLAYVEKPVPSENQVLIKVRAASLNAIDVYVTRDSWLGRLIF